MELPKNINEKCVGCSCLQKATESFCNITRLDEPIYYCLGDVEMDCIGQKSVYNKG